MLHLHEEVAIKKCHVVHVPKGVTRVKLLRNSIILFPKIDFWKVSVTNEFIALTSLKYETWEDFQEASDSSVGNSSEVLDLKNCQRIGLRYRDIIDRENSGCKASHGLNC